MVRKRRVPSVSDAVFGKPFGRTVKNPLAVDFPKLYPSQPKEKDSRRSFSPTQQKAILHQQDNKCAICHEKLDPRATEFDHKKPWASGGRTIKENGRALCANCHKIATHETRLKQIDKKRKPKNTKPFSGLI